MNGIDAFALPTHDGVGASRVTVPEGPWPTLLDFLCERFAHVGADEWQARFERGDVLDERGAVLQATQRCVARLRLHYYRSLPPEPTIPFQETVLYRDDHLLVVDKPHFLPVTPAGRYLQQTLLVRLKRRLGVDALAPIHRLDRETAGLVLFSLRASTRGLYQSLFQQRRVDKGYEAIAPVRDDLVLPRVHRSRIVQAEPFMRMQEVAGDPNSETAIALIERRGDLGRYQLRPRTGLKHQLRVHMAALGIPIVDDTIYPALQPPGLPPDYRRPLRLLAKSLAFVDPCSGQERRFESGLALTGGPGT